MPDSFKPKGPLTKSDNTKVTITEIKETNKLENVDITQKNRLINLLLQYREFFYGRPGLNKKIVYKIQIKENKIINA